MNNPAVHVLRPLFPSSGLHVISSRTTRFLKFKSCVPMSRHEVTSKQARVPRLDLMGHRQALQLPFCRMDGTATLQAVPQRSSKATCLVSRFQLAKSCVVRFPVGRSVAIAHLIASGFRQREHACPSHGKPRMLAHEGDLSYALSQGPWKIRNSETGRGFSANEACCKCGGGQKAWSVRGPATAERLQV